VGLTSATALPLVVQELRKSVADRTITREALRTLGALAMRGHCDPASLNLVVRAISRHRYRAADTLVRLAEAGLGSAEAAARLREALGKMMARGRPKRSVTVEGLEDEFDVDRLRLVEAVAASARIGIVDEGSVPLLRELASAAYQPLALAAAEALRALGATETAAR